MVLLSGWDSMQLVASACQAHALLVYTVSLPLQDTIYTSSDVLVLSLLAVASITW